MYPIWEGVYVHSAMFGAIIATFHILASHVTVAASCFNIHLERWAYQDKNAEFSTALAGVGKRCPTTVTDPCGIVIRIHHFVNKQIRKA